MSATPDNTLANPEQRIADLERQLAASNAERDKAQAREAALAEVLQVINSSPDDLAPVFNAMLESTGIMWGGLRELMDVRWRKSACGRAPRSAA